MSELKSDRMLEALEELEAVKAKLKHDWGDPGSNLHMAIETLKDSLAQQLLVERRRIRPPHLDVTPRGVESLEPLVIPGYNDEPPERSTLGHTGHPPADRGASEAGCYG